MSLYYESHEEKVRRMLEGLESSLAEMREAMMLVLKQDAPIHHEDWCASKDEGLVLCRTCGVKRVYAPMRGPTESPSKDDLTRVADTESVLLEPLDYEVCRECELPSVSWCAPNPLWLEVMQYRGGTVCPLCFDRLAAEKGVMVQWRGTLHPAYSDDRRDVAGTEGKMAHAVPV